MKTLAILGHPTRGKEVIKILEMLGGQNISNNKGNGLYLYYIDDNNFIGLKTQYQTNFIIFTLEQFIEKYPYKIGDKVLLDNQVKVIKGVGWDSKNNEVIYTLEANINGTKTQYQVFNYDLQPYKEDDNMNQENETETTEINLNHPCFDGYNKIELTLPDNWKFKQKDGKIFGVRKQYPKTYEECSKILHTSCSRISTPGYRECQISLFQELIICRDAYWKIAGEEMGFSGSWNPDWTKADERKYCIVNTEGNITKWVQKTTNKILAFPTKEMRDAFFENFKELIENCKEFL